VTATIALALTTAAYADFSYKTTRKSTGGMMAGMMANGRGVPEVSTISLKGQKMKVDSGNTATILDYDAQTITTLDNAAKTYTVRNFSDMTGAADAGNIDAKVDVKETGQKKVINGFNSNEAILTMEMESPQARQMGKMQVEMDMWLSPDVPGASELHEFFRKNGSKFMLGAAGPSGNSSMHAAIAEMQRKMTSMNGVPVEQIIRLRSAGAPAVSSAQMGQMQDAMAQARARLEAMKAQGGPQAAAAAQALARMGGGSPAASSSGSGALVEITMDSTDFSTNSIPASVFEIPAGYQKK
jgi:hypothetical protein